MNKLVSIVTPCYGGESYMHRWAKSILFQTYRPLEIYLIDDGSKDQTGEVFRSYIRKFEQSDIKANYIYQENSGQAAALNRGLSLFKGDYLIWPDSDDYLFPESISKRVAFLEENPKFGLVRSDGVKTTEVNPYIASTYISGKQRNRFNEEIFEDLLLSQTFITPVCYMVRRSAFLEVCPQLSIYPHRTGQNYQMLLPITRAYPCGYIDEPLCAYVVRPNSHSKTSSGKTLEKHLERISGAEDIILHVLEEMGAASRYGQLVYLKYMRQRLEQACRYRNIDLGRDCIDAIKKHRAPTLQEQWWYVGSCARIFSPFIAIMQSLATISLRIRKKIRTNLESPRANKDLHHALYKKEGQRCF